MKVSIIIPCYNQGKWLIEAIESCLNQTYKDIEIIVVNDGSTDNTNEISLKYPVTLISQPNQWVGVARNNGIKIAKGEYILCLDADDTVEPTFIEECVSLMSDEVDIVGTGQKEFGDSHNEHLFLENPRFEHFKEFNQINCSSLFKRKMWEDIGMWDETRDNIYTDWEFWLRATKNGYKVKTIRKPLFNYRKHGKSMITDAIKRHKELHEYILKRNNI